MFVRHDGDQFRLFDDRPQPVLTYGWWPGEFTRLREKVEIVRCEQCDLPLSRRRAHVAETWEPWGDEPDVTYWHRGCADQYGGDPEESFWCEFCSRQVWEHRGYRINYKWVADGGMMMCVKCWQADMFEHGITEETIRDKDPMVDFFSEPDLIERGFTRLETLYPEKEDDWDRLRLVHIVRKFIKAGWIVILDQGRTSIVGGPDSIDLWGRLLPPEGVPE